jgi:hypothetical protein
MEDRRYSVATHDGGTLTLKGRTTAALAGMASNFPLHA